jgi:beta-N-acetylhexosaminidase
VELPPFRAAIRAGIPAIMTTHILFPGLDPSGKPATLSPALLTDLLRGTLGFGGLIVTDCMQMQAIAGTLGTPAGCVAALAAGADLLLVCHDEDVQAASMAAVAEAVRAGALTQAQLDDRVRRVLEAKRAWLTGAATPPAAALTDAALAEHRAFAARLAADAITLLRDRDGLLPLTGKRLFSLAPAASGLSIAEDLEEGGVHFAAECAGRFGGDWCGFDVAQAPDADLRQRILAGCAQADVVLFGACNASLYPTQATLLREVLAQGTPVILCALRLPYDAALADTPAALCAYDYTPASVQALLSLLAGERPATGTLPVRLG